jgi:hypothetical protein
MTNESMVCEKEGRRKKGEIKAIDVIWKAARRNSKGLEKW